MIYVTFVVIFVQAQKERNVLAHQSALLMAEVSEEPNARLLSVLMEVESLKRQLEEEKQQSELQIRDLQDKLEEKESSIEFEIVEEKLRLAETELEVAVRRAERAENSSTEAESIVKELRKKVLELEEKLSRPPVPPPPPPMPNFQQSTVKKFLAKENQQTCASNDMEDPLTVKKPTNVPQQPGILRILGFKKLMKTSSMSDELIKSSCKNL